MDLNGYAVWLKQNVEFYADKDGNVKLPSARVARMAEFMQQVVDELLDLIPEDEVEQVDRG